MQRTFWVAFLPQPAHHQRLAPHASPYSRGKFGFPALRGQPLLAPARIAEQVHAREQFLRPGERETLPHSAAEHRRASATPAGAPGSRFQEGPCRDEVAKVGKAASAFASGTRARFP